MDTHTLVQEQSHTLLDQVVNTSLNPCGFRSFINKHILPGDYIHKLFFFMYHTIELTKGQRCCNETLFNLAQQKSTLYL